MTAPPRPHVSLATARQPGAIALVQLHGQGIAPLLHDLTNVRDWPTGRLRLVELGALDQGLAVRLTEHWAQLMPHGGPRVVQKLIDHLLDLGCDYISDPPARAMYPEADSDVEAEALAAIARAASPAAIDLLAAQPALWRDWRAGGHPLPPGLLARSVVLDRLIDPPAVVVVGPPNVGKSTLTNRMLGRSASLVADLPGTTRDWVAGLAELASSAAPTAAIAVRWMDTPGLRVSDDAIEQEAIALAQQVVAQAEVLIAMRDPQSDWPTLAALPREPDVWVVNKVDDAAAVDGLTAGASRAAPLPISAERDRNIDALHHRVLGVLGLDVLESNELWAFCAPLRDALGRGDVAALRDWV